LSWAGIKRSIDILLTWPLSAFPNTTLNGYHCEAREMKNFAIFDFETWPNLPAIDLIADYLEPVLKFLLQGIQFPTIFDAFLVEAPKLGDSNNENDFIRSWFNNYGKVNFSKCTLNRKSVHSIVQSCDQTSLFFCNARQKIKWRLLNAVYCLQWGTRHQNCMKTIYFKKKVVFTIFSFKRK
jgi:hypothetical protein